MNQHRDALRQSVARFLTVIFLGAGVALFGPQAIAEEKSAPSSGGSSETQVDEPRKLPGEPVGVKPLSPGDTPGQGSAGLNSGQGSAVGAGLKFSIGDKRKTKGKVKRQSKLVDEAPANSVKPGSQ